MNILYLRLSSLNKLVIVQLNINILRIKLDGLAEKITGNINILVISETKSSRNNSSRAGEFLI